MEKREFSENKVKSNVEKAENILEKEKKIEEIKDIAQQKDN